MAPHDADVSGPAPALKENFPTEGRQSLLPAFPGASKTQLRTSPSPLFPVHFSLDPGSLQLTPASFSSL